MTTSQKPSSRKRNRTAVDDVNLPRVVDMDVGNRFKLSALGAERCPRLAKQVGIVTAIIPNSRTICVRFDGNKNPTSIYKDYIEPFESEEAR